MTDGEIFSNFLSFLDATESEHEFGPAASGFELGPVPAALRPFYKRMNGASLFEVVERTLAPWMSAPDSEPARVTIDGPPIRLSPNAAVTVNMAVHELATNASKYGALSARNGRLSVHWAIDNSKTPPCMDLHWIETGGPAVEQPRQRGFGSRLIEQGLPRELGGEVRLNFLREGVQCDVHLPLSRSSALRAPRDHPAVGGNNL